MKKLKALVLALMLAAVVLSAVGCKASEKPAEQPPVPTSIPTQRINETDSNNQSTEPQIVDMPILDEINENTRVGTAGSSLSAISSAVKLLDWAAGTGLDPVEIKASTVSWINKLSTEDRQEFLAKLESVSFAVETLTDDDSNATQLMADAGTESQYYPWDDAAEDIVEDIMEAAGIDD